MLMMMMVMCGEPVSVLAYGSSLHLYYRPFVSLAACIPVRHCCHHAPAQDTPLPVSLLHVSLPSSGLSVSALHLLYLHLVLSPPSISLLPSLYSTCLQSFIHGSLLLVLVLLFLTPGLPVYTCVLITCFPVSLLNYPLTAPL